MSHIFLNNSDKLLADVDSRNPKTELNNPNQGFDNWRFFLDKPSRAKAFFILLNEETGFYVAMSKMPCLRHFTSMLISKPQCFALQNYYRMRNSNTYLYYIF